MRFSVPHNWQPDLLPRMKKDKVAEVYSKLSSDFVGGGRASYALPHVSKRRARGYIAEVHRSGIKFNYLINATCLGNFEWTRGGQRRLSALLDWIAEAGADAVTVSIPYLLELIKKRYPGLQVCVSTQAGVDSVRCAKYWEGLGADRITLAERSVNRNFPLLRQIRRNVKCGLQLIANLDCLYHCPFWIYHGLLNSHGSQETHPLGGFFIDYCSLACNYIKLKDPSEFIRAGWIRPEDVHYYEEAGIDGIKLVNRAMTTDSLLTVVNAYTNGTYDGNLLDLFSRPSRNVVFRRPNILHKLRYFFRPFHINVFALFEARRLLGEIEVRIDNRSLDGFIRHFLEGNCDLRSCAECGYCSDVARRAVSVSPDWQERAVLNYRECLENLFGPRMFGYI